MGLSPGFLELARKLIAADTVSANGTRAAADVLQPLWENAGLHVRRQVVDDIHVNLLGGPGGDASGPGGVLLVTHLDTVPAGPQWQTDPWTLTEKDGALFGLGVADVKLDALCKAEAARRLRGRKCARPFWLLGTYGEEVGLRGARHFVESDLFAEVRPAQVLCGEPSELQIISAHKGYVVVRCTVHDEKARLVSSAGPGVEQLKFAGKAAHSSTPHLGVNAIQKALQWARSSGSPVLSAQGGTSSNVVPASCVLEVPAPRERGQPEPDEVKFVPPRTEEPALPATGGARRAQHPTEEPALPATGGARRAQHPTEEPNLWRALATASALEDLWQQTLPRGTDARFDPPGAVGGLNVLSSGPAGVAIQLDARLLPQHDPDALVAQFVQNAQKWIEQLGHGDLTLAVSVERNAAGMALPDDAPLVRSAQKALARQGLDTSARAKPTSTEAGVFARGGCQAIVIGPGRSTGNAHTANERIEMAQLEKACDLYQSLLEELCSCS